MAHLKNISRRRVQYTQYCHNLGLISTLIIMALQLTSGASSPNDVPVSSSTGTASTATTTTTGSHSHDTNAITSTKDFCAKGESWCSTLDDNEILALEAIRCLHRQLDDDKDGNINLDESDEYLREELKYEKDYEKRHKVFHRNNDNQVSVRELWETWVKSEVHNWTMEQTLDWLNVFVGLPQYQSVFVENNINGTALPRLAVNHLQFLSSTVGVKDVIHKQKISLKAQDVVLFGSPKDYTNHIKDMILTTLLAIAIIVCWFVYSRYKISQRDLVRMIKDMELLAKAEKELLDLQKVMEKNKLEQQSQQVVEAVNHVSSHDGEFPPTEEISRLRTELDVLRGELQRAEVELQDKCWVPPPALQHWLQLTYELELKSYNKKKISAERQLKLAKDACDKLKKKRSSLMGAFVSTHGRSIDDVDKAILEARTSLTEITIELQERMHRWKQIEMLVNSPIMNNPGLQYLENTLRGYGRGSSYGGAASVISNSQDDIDDDAASSIYCPSAVHKLVSGSTFLMFPGQQNLPPFSSAINSSRLCQCQSMHCELSSPQSPSPTIPSFGGNPNCSTSNGSARSTMTQYFEQNINDRSSSSSPQISPRIPKSQTSQSQSTFCSISEEASSSSIDSDNSVSAPASTSSHLPIIRSKSVASMLSYREKAIRDLANREANQADDEIASEASEMVTGTRDRRVTFGIRTDHRNDNVNAGKSGALCLASSEKDEVERKYEMRKFLSSYPPVASQNFKESEEPQVDRPSESIGTGSHPEEPDLIKIPLSLPSVKPETGVENTTLLLIEDGKENGSEIKGGGKEKSDKTGFWKSISKFVARSSEGIIHHHHRHHKVHGAENGSATPATTFDKPSLTTTVSIKGDEKELSTTPHEKKSRSFLSSLKRSHKNKSSN